MEGKDTMGMKMRRSIYEKATVRSNKEERLLIHINVFGSTGAIRFVVKGDDSATAVIQTALKIYAREGRLPILGSDAGTFYLYTPHAGFQALNPWENIGSRGARSFMLRKKEGKPQMTEARSEIINGKMRGWRARLQKSLILKLISQ